MGRKLLVGGEEKGDWFEAVMSWAAPSPPKPPVEKKVAPPVEKKKPKPKPPVKEAEEPPPPVKEAEEPPAAPKQPKRPLVCHPCGHLNFASAAQDEAARAGGKCCGNHGHMINWSVRGVTQPVPVSQRRSFEKEQNVWAWPGLCCDPDTHLYIGGLGNDCRYYHKGPERCVVHTAKPPKAAKGSMTACEERPKNEHP